MTDFSHIRTRFAPSPTGFLHLGGARTALFSWAFARHYGGTFILRIEDTDLERSTPEAVQAILDGMNWLGLTPDEGPFYQMQHMDRYREVLAGMLAAGTAYHCYSSPEEVDAMREAAKARGDKPRYDGTWRPEPGKTLPSIPADRKPVVRFKNPLGGATAWVDMVKGPISIDNGELDDLIIARPDGTPTYNFCVVVDDWDMRISHVLRGDDHVNNTPRQINILRALGAPIPQYGHVPMILGPDGEKLSKRHGAVSVMEYHHEGYLAEGMVNAHYLKQSDNASLARAVSDRISARGGNPAAINLVDVVELLKDRAETLEQLADAAMLFCGPFQPAGQDLIAQHLTASARVVLADFAQQAATIDWTKDAIAALIKSVLASHGLKMPQLAIPLRVAVAGTTQTPAIDAVLALLGREVVLNRLNES